jgi:hypothetical protein
MQQRVNLKDYRFTDLQLCWIGRTSSVGHNLPQVQVSQGPPPEEGGTTWLTKLEVSLDPESEKSGYQLRITVAAVLDVVQDQTEPYDASRAGYLAALNGATILYGIVRAEVASLTSNFPGGRHILEAVYMQEVLKSQSDALDQDLKNQS